jgi:cytoskeleton protein RodZ
MVSKVSSRVILLSFAIRMVQLPQFGEALRQERERLGISLDQISSATKVSLRYLQALEQNEFRLLPGGILNKGIVRSYVTQLGLDQETWIEYFLASWRESGSLGDEEADWIAFAENVGSSRHGRRGSTGLKWLGVILMVALVGALAFGVWMHLNGRLDF